MISHSRTVIAPRPSRNRCMAGTPWRRVSSTKYSVVPSVDTVGSTCLSNAATRR